MESLLVPQSEPWGPQDVAGLPGAPTQALEESPDGEDNVRALISCDPVGFPRHLT